MGSGTLGLLRKYLSAAEAEVPAVAAAERLMGREVAVVVDVAAN